MSVEFRQRTPSEYARILWQRKWLIVLPALAISFAIAIVVWRLPDVYQSVTLLAVKPSSVPSAIAPQLSDEDLTIELLRSKSVLVHPGHFYDFPGEGHLVLSLIGPKAGFAEGIRRVLEMVDG